MAYAALVSLAQTTDLILNHDDKYSLSVDAKENIKSIREYVILLISFLENFPDKANRLEGKIRDLANGTEDIIEDFMWRQIQKSSRTAGLSRFEFENQLAKVTEKIGSIAGEMMDDRRSEQPATISSPRLGSTGKNDVVIGLDDDLMAIKGRLCGESPNLQVIPIVGMAGIGKTTLTRYAYDDPLVMECFYIRAWVTISQNYSAQEVLSGLLDSTKILLEEQLSGQKNELPMEEKMYKSLKGRRYLIVIDDVWSTKAWDDVRKIFPDDTNGSRIMLTTRLSSVAAYAGSGGPLHEMRFMDENQSWNLLKHKVFSNNNGQDCPPELEETGKEIAQSCRGLPLAIVLVAGILSTVAKARASWEEIANNVNSVVDGQLERILSLSYTHLPHHLRPCFLFIGGYPGYYKIHVSRLIKLWVAEGFLRCQNGCKSLEEKAEEYLEDLVKRNLVLVTRRKSNGKIKRCSLHDLVRDLCLRKAQEENFLLHVTDCYALQDSIRKVHRISISHFYLSYLGPNIRTIVCFQYEKFSCKTSLAFVEKFRLLRVLDAVYHDFVELPDQLFELFHLRYLALGRPARPLRISSAISNLKNLQTLIISPHPKSGSPSHYLSLPVEIWRMPQVRHLVFPCCYLLPDPSTDGSTLPLENLQTLSGVADLVCEERILKMIPNLKKLLLYGVDYKYYRLHNLKYLEQLEKLKVTVERKCSWQGQNPFPTTLKKLTLVGGRLPWTDMTMVGSLPNLEVLKLKNFACDGDTWETTEGEFPQLKFLLIKESRLQYWITESDHFPKLKCLVLHHCPCLIQIPNSIGDIPTLKLIEVDNQNKSLVVSAKEIQEDQQSYGNGDLQVRCVHLDELKKQSLEENGSFAPNQEDTAGNHGVCPRKMAR